jgi:hypothetical protein
MVTDLSELALCVERRPFDVTIDLHARQLREIRHHLRSFGTRSRRIASLEQERETCPEFLRPHPSDDRLDSIAPQTV